MENKDPQQKHTGCARFKDGRKGWHIPKPALNRKNGAAMNTVGRKERGRRNIEGICARVPTGEEPACALDDGSVGRVVERMKTPADFSCRTGGQRREREREDVSRIGVERMSSRGWRWGKGGLGEKKINGLADGRWTGWE